MISNLVRAVTVPNQIYRFDFTLHRHLRKIRESMNIPQQEIEWWGNNESFRSHRSRRAPPRRAPPGR